MSLHFIFCSLAVLVATGALTPLAAASDHQVLAEWEPQEATWMQWPGAYEVGLEPVFVDIIDVVHRYQPVVVVVASERMRRRVHNVLSERGIDLAQLRWMVAATDNAWLRDNGPVYVREGSDLRVLDFRFDAWGGNFGRDVPYRHDDAIPPRIAQWLGLPLEAHDYVLERGNLEVNGAGVAVLNWTCQLDRNPTLSQDQHEAALMDALGVHTILWAEGHHPEDRTTGHIDGIARFISTDTLVVSSAEGLPTEANLAALAEAAGLRVLRYPGDINWLVGNGFVLANASDFGESATAAERAAWEATLHGLLTEFFPGRAVHLIDGAVINQQGGGIHCLTNDQPVVGP